MIYLVDDDPIQNLITSQLMSKFLNELDYRIFNNGKELLDALKTKPKPKIILLDINMPIMDGWELLEEYNRLDNQANVMMLTSSLSIEDYELSKKYDFVKGYYTKPIDEKVIVEILESVYYTS